MSQLPLRFSAAEIPSFMYLEIARQSSKHSIHLTLNKLEFYFSTTIISFMKQACNQWVHHNSQNIQLFAQLLALKKFPVFFFYLAPLCIEITVMESGQRNCRWETDTVIFINSSSHKALKCCVSDCTSMLMRIKYCSIIVSSILL